MKKTVFITGGTGGIGKAAAVALAKQGNDIIIQGRDAAKGKAIEAEISKISGATCKFIQADISTVEGVKQLASEVKKLTNKIDIFVHSTGTLNSDRRETKEGMEEGFMVNYLNKFMLDNLLQNELKNGEGKVIIVGAPLMKNAAVNFDDLQMKSGYSLMKAMGQNMMAVHMHAQEYTKRNPGKPVNIVHPGLVNTGILRNTKGPMKFFFNVFGPMMYNSPEKAVINIMELADGNSNESGFFYPKVAKPAAKQKISLDAATAAKLWEESSKIAKL